MSMGLALILSLLVPPDGDGERIYRAKCASCHGADGQGTKDNPDPLTGKRSVEGLTSYIDRKMPEDKPKTVTGDDARKVAAYIYDAFYSPAAHARITRPRVAFARLTVNQHLNAVADLLATFRDPGRPDDKRGVTFEIFKGGRRLRGRAVESRVEKTVDLDLGDKPPSGKVKPDEFALRWSGGVFAPDTGDYEFVLETPNGARLWVNDPEVPLIDQWVRSGTGTTHRGSVRLLGGRVYPFRVEVFKAKAKEAKNNEKRLALTLKWKRPHRVEEIVPERVLRPGRFRETFVLRTPFPPDDRSMGWVRGTSVSRAWDDATTRAALETAAHVVDRAGALGIGDLADKDARRRLLDWGRRFVERAFRRPLTPEERKFFVDRLLPAAANAGEALKKLVLLTLKSPRFLYRAPGEDPHAMASRLSFALWDSLPDRALLDAAAQGKLGTREQVAAHAERMLGDPRAKAKIREFYHSWLGVDRLEELSKDEKRYPDFTEAIVSDLRTSLDLFLDDVTWSEKSDFRRLLVADVAFMNGRLATFYGVKLPGDAPFKRVKMETGRSAGMLTHPLLLAGMSYNATTSPIHRGVFVARSLLGRRLKPPPQAVTPTPPDLKPDLTTRERITEQTRPAACQACHEMINPLGFTLEEYDAVGRFREKEKGRRIDASGFYRTGEGEAVKFAGARELGTFLSASPEAHSAFVEQLFHFMVQQPVLAFGADAPERLLKTFGENGFSIRRLLVEMMTVSAVPARNVGGGKK